MVIKISHDIYFVYLRAGKSLVHAIITVVTAAKKNISRSIPGSNSSIKGNSPTVAPTIISTNKVNANQRFFAGPQIDLSYDKISEPAKYLVDQPDYKRLGGTAHGYSNFSSGVGFLLTYDSRDIPANAYKGIYLDFRGLMYQKFLGGDNNFYRLEVDYRQYKKVGNRKVIAWTAQTKNVFGDVPMNQYALSGTPFDLRGYYMGQYRDKSSHVVLAEYRQMFNTDKSTWVKRMLHHLGFVAWGGCGFMGPTMGKIEGVLPNAGVGLRIEVQPRMNVRLDFGRNFANDQSLFYFNMTEAF